MMLQNPHGQIQLAQEFEPYGLNGLRLSKSHPTLLLSLIARISPTKLSRPRTSIQRDTTRATEWRCHGFLGEIFAPHLRMSTYMKFHNLEVHDGWHLFFACHPGFGAPGGQALWENPYRIVNSQASVTSLKLASKMSRTLASSAKPSERELRQEDHFGNSRQQKGISKTQLWNIKKRVVSDLQACRHCPRIRSVLIHTLDMTYGASHCAIKLNETFKTTRWSEYLVLSYPFCICPSRFSILFQDCSIDTISWYLVSSIHGSWSGEFLKTKRGRSLNDWQLCSMRCPVDPSISFHWHRFDQAIGLADHCCMNDSCI